MSQSSSGPARMKVKSKNGQRTKKREKEGLRRSGDFKKGGIL